jgi:hypothetical protein
MGEVTVYGFAHETPHGYVVSKTMLTPNSVPLVSAYELADAFQEVANSDPWEMWDNFHDLIAKLRPETTP